MTYSQFDPEKLVFFIGIPGSGWAKIDSLLRCCKKFNFSTSDFSEDRYEEKKGLKYYDDIMKRIPRSEIEDYEEILQEAFDEVKNPGSKFEIVGSYRRGNKDSGDIDVIITDENNDRKVFGNFLDALLKRKVLLEMLSRGKVKS